MPDKDTRWFENNDPLCSVFLVKNIFTVIKSFILTVIL